MAARKEDAVDAERRRRRREERIELLRQLDEEAAGPPPIRLTLASARAEWPALVTAQNERRVKGRDAAAKVYGPVVADLLVDIHLPELPPPTELVAYALDLECGHEALRLAKRSDTTAPTPDSTRCPIFWSCQLNEGRTAVRYIEPGEPEAKDAEFGWTRWSVALACGHTGEVLSAEGEDRVGDYQVCRSCGGDDPDFDAQIVALGERLPDRMVQNWKVELDCGHIGIDHFIPVEFKDDPAAYRAERPCRTGLHCTDAACDERQVREVRRLGVLGKIRIPPLPPPDPVATAARDLRRRLTKEERQSLIRQLQDDE